MTKQDLKVPLAQDQREFDRTRRALAQEIDELVRKKAALSLEVDALIAERTGGELAQAIDDLAAYNQRLFERVLEREIHRCAREVGAKFSAVQISTSGMAPVWFGEFVGQIVRLSDLSIKVATNTWMVFLSGAGGLGRRLFLARFARALQGAQETHEREVEVLLGGATYPVDGDNAPDLVATAARREKRLTLSADLSVIEVEAPRRPASTKIELMPPDGVIEASHVDADPDRVLDAIQAGITSGQAGELVVRSENVVGRVYLYNGKIAWTHCTSRDVSLAEYLVGVGGIDPEEIRFAYDHCRQTGDNFAETLIEFGTFEREEMRGVLCQHLRAHLDAVLTLPSPELLFLPQNRVYNSDLIFSLSTLISHRPKRRDEIIESLRAKQTVSVKS